MALEIVYICCCEYNTYVYKCMYMWILWENLEAKHFLSNIYFACMKLIRVGFFVALCCCCCRFIFSSLTFLLIVVVIVAAVVVVVAAAAVIVADVFVETTVEITYTHTINSMLDLTFISGHLLACQRNV